MANLYVLFIYEDKTFITISIKECPHKNVYNKPAIIIVQTNAVCFCFDVAV